MFIVFQKMTSQLAWLIHLSFIDKMNERRVALVPVVVDETIIDEIFEDVKSPALIRIFLRVIQR